MTTLALSPHSKSAHNVAEHLHELRDALIQQRDFRIEQLVELTATDSSYGANDPRNQVLNAVKSAAIVALADTDAALQRLAHGCYGRCAKCENPIPLERLEILPMARLCTGCQHAEEAAAWRADHLRDYHPIQRN
jgi:DnaK suppressor protein